MLVPLSERQARTVAAAVTTLAGLVMVLTGALVGWLAASFLRAFSGVFLPLAVGAIAALVCRPLYDLLVDRVHLPAALALLVVFAALTLPVVAFLWVFGRLLLAQALALVTQLPAWLAAARSWLQARTPQLNALLARTGIDEGLVEAARAQQGAVVAGLQALGAHAWSAGAGLARAAGALLSWAVVPVYFAFFLSARGLRIDSRHLLPFLKADTRADVEYLAATFVDMLVAFFRGQLLIALLQGLLYAAGFSAIGLRYGFVIGLLLGLLNVVPYLGSIVGLALTLPIALLQEAGGWSLAAVTLLVFLLVQQIEGWLLTPKIMGDRTGLHFMAIIVAVFFWGTALGGVLGMILAIPLTAFLASLWRLARDKYIPELF